MSAAPRVIRKEEAQRLGEMNHKPREKPKTVGIVIRNLNEEQHIGRLLSGVAHQTMQPNKIVIVDSGSTDASVEIASRFGAQIENIDPRIFSFGRSLNIGCEAADTDFIVVASAHVYPVYDTWLEKLLAPFEDERIALSYGRQIGGHTTKFSEAQLMRRWFPEVSTAVQAHPFCNNANAAIRRDLWKSEPYNEELTGLEDLAWARRAIELGYLLAYVAESPVVHAHDETWNRLRNRYRREAIAHRRIYADERMRAGEALALLIRNVSADYATAIRQGRLLRNFAAIPSFHSAQFIGAYQGFLQDEDTPGDLKRRFYYPTDETEQGAVGSSIGRKIDYMGQQGAHANA